MQVKKISLLIIILLINSCSPSSVVTSSFAYMLSQHSKFEEQGDIKFNALVSCPYNSKIDMYKYSVYVSHRPLDEIKKNNFIFFPKDIVSNKPVNLKKINYIYAYEYIALKMGDTRVEGSKLFLQDKERNNWIKQQIDKRYYPSYLNKCFYVPTEYDKSKYVKSITY